MDQKTEQVPSVVGSVEQLNSLFEGRAHSHFSDEIRTIISSPSLLKI